MAKKICISGYYGFDNFGDETILKVLIDNLKQFKEKPQITVFSSNPAKTSTELEVNSVKSFNALAVIGSLFKCDCLISGGGSLLQDATSAKSLIYYLGIITLAQIFRKKTIIFAQGIGPIKNKRLAKLTAKVLKRVNYITVRDEASIKLLDSWGIKATKCDDPVWNIKPIAEKNTKVGVQLRAFKTLTDEFIEQLANCINKYYKDKDICIYSLQNKLDLEVSNKLCQKLKTKTATVIENTSNEKIIKDLASLEVLIAMRFHACLIAIKGGVKLLPINYDIKVEQLAKEFNLNCLNLDYLEINKIIFEQFKQNPIEYETEKINNLMFDFKTLEEII